MSPRNPRTSRLRFEQLESRQMLSHGVWEAFQPPAINYAAVADDYGSTLATAAQVSLSAAGSGARSGTIEQAGDVDVFRFVAPITGSMTIQQAAAAGSRLDSYLYAYNAGGQMIARNDDNGSSYDSRVEINVTAGTTYYVVASAYGRSTGAYTVRFDTAGVSVDDYGNTAATAASVSLSAAGSATRSGAIEQAGDVDVFRFVAPVSGRMTIQQAAAPGSRLDSYLYAYNADGQMIARNDDDGSSLNSRVQIDVSAGATYYVKASAYLNSVGAYALQFSTVASTPPTTPPAPTPPPPVTPPPPTPSPAPGGFQIDVTMTGMTASQQQIVQQAADRWEQIIVGDLPDVVYRGQVIDDLQIDISGVSIDGAGGILGQSAPTGFRSGSDLPYRGFIQLDTTDVAAMQRDGSLLGVIEHEIAHVLGFGVIWSDLGLLAGANTNNPRFLGSRATAEYNATFGVTQTSVPIEAEGGPGTRLSHWDESIFRNELMTGWYNSGAMNPISRITVASLADLGYQVNLAAADPYSRPA